MSRRNPTGKNYGRSGLAQISAAKTAAEAEARMLGLLAHYGDASSGTKAKWERAVRRHKEAEGR